MKKVGVSFAVKLIGMALVFAVSKSIIDVFGLEAFGVYSLALAIVNVFVGIATVGFPQTFLRTASGCEPSQVKKIFVRQHRVILTFALILAPFLYLTLWVKMGNGLLEALIVAYFLIYAGSRLRFSLIRVSSISYLSEFPDQIVRPLVLLGFIYLVTPDDTQYIFWGLLVASTAAMFFQIASSRSYHISFSVFSLLSPLTAFKSINKNNVNIWIYNVVITIKDLLDLWIIAYLFGDSFGGEFKIILQFSLVLMAVFNSFNLINSSRYAALLKDGEVGGDAVSNKMVVEFKKSISFFAFVFVAYFGFISYFSVLSYFKLSEQAFVILSVACISPFVNILLGPYVQLAMHSYNAPLLVVMNLIKIISLLIVGFLGVSMKFDFLFVAIAILLVNVLVNVLCAIFLYRKLGVDIPVLGFVKSFG